MQPVLGEETFGGGDVDRPIADPGHGASVMLVAALAAWLPPASRARAAAAPAKVRRRGKAARERGRAVGMVSSL